MGEGAGNLLYERGGTGGGVEVGQDMGRDARTEALALAWAGIGGGIEV